MLLLSLYFQGDDTVIECAVATETLMSVNHSRNNGRNNARLGVSSMGVDSGLVWLKTGHFGMNTLIVGWV